MLVSVIYADGKKGKEERSNIDNLIAAGNIVAFKSQDGWVEVRRKRNTLDRSPERRSTGIA